MVQRRKNSNWFSRQLTRMGSMRSSSTAYSSNGLFKRNRHNSVYSSPESRIVLPGQQQLGPPPATQKMSFYDKLRGKSMRNQRQMLKRGTKNMIRVCLKKRENHLNTADIYRFCHLFRFKDKPKRCGYVVSAAKESSPNPHARRIKGR